MGQGHGLEPSRRVDPLLPGETADSDIRDDADHWISVYEELIGFLLGSEASDGAVARYRDRLRFWRLRREQLAAAIRPNGHAGGALE